MLCIFLGLILSTAEPYLGDPWPPVADKALANPQGSAVVAIESEPPSLNYQLDPQDSWAKKIGGLIFESLASPDPNGTSHTPLLAESWSEGDDHQIITFNLRKGVLWHDGKPFTADDVIFTFDILRHPKTHATGLRPLLDAITRYEKQDAFTVKFFLAEPYVFAFDAIAEVHIYPKHIFSTGDFNSHPKNRAPIGTGPFVFDKWVPKDRIVIRRHTHYYGDPAKLATLVFKIVPDPNKRVQLLTRGDVDLVEKVPPDIWQRESMQLGKKFWRLRHLPNGLQWVGWNIDRPFFADTRVRRALTQLINRTAVVDNLRFGVDTVAASWFYPGTVEFNDALAPLPYDLEAAKTLLDRAGWIDHDGDGVRDKEGVPFRFVLSYPAGNAFYQELVTLVAESLRAAQIEVDTARFEWPTFTAKLSRHDFDACALLWQQDPRSDPSQIWHSRAVSGGFNFINYKNPQMDDLLTRARQTYDDDTRVALYHRFSAMLQEEQPYTMLFHRHNLSLVSKRLSGLVATPYGTFRYAEIFRLKD